MRWFAVMRDRSRLNVWNLKISVRTHEILALHANGGKSLGTRYARNCSWRLTTNSSVSHMYSELTPPQQFNLRTGWWRVPTHSGDERRSRDAVNQARRLRSTATIKLLFLFSTRSILATQENERGGIDPMLEARAVLRWRRQMSGLNFATLQTSWAGCGISCQLKRWSNNGSTADLTTDPKQI